MSVGIGGTIMLKINEQRLLNRINQLGEIGIDENGARTRAAASDTKKPGAIR